MSSPADFDALAAELRSIYHVGARVIGTDGDESYFGVVAEHGGRDLVIATATGERRVLWGVVMFIVAVGVGRFAAGVGEPVREIRLRVVDDDD